MIEIDKIRYPELERIANLKPNPEILLGQEIYWTVKRDGSNIGVYLDDEDNIQLRSRNLPIASDMFYSGFKQVTHADAIKEMILNERDYCDEIVVFGEMLMKGRSPTRIEMHEDFDTCR